jgi:hypothetical protein
MRVVVLDEGLDVLAAFFLFDFAFAADRFGTGGKSLEVDERPIVGRGGEGGDTGRM